MMIFVPTLGVAVPNGEGRSSRDDFAVATTELLSALVLPGVKTHARGIEGHRHPQGHGANRQHSIYEPAKERDGVLRFGGI
ncbi:MAG TPA: hypothetical protein VMU81_24615 [Acetobacteraceae bacterium]|nr:hypothetical protein [Acetobacteraceae bacterium]